VDNLFASFALYFNKTPFGMMRVADSRMSSVDLSPTKTPAPYLTDTLPSGASGPDHLSILTFKKVTMTANRHNQFPYTS
jgi:hypothetical protein